VLLSMGLPLVPTPAAKIIALKIYPPKIFT